MRSYPYWEPDTALRVRRTVERVTATLVQSLPVSQLKMSARVKVTRHHDASTRRDFSMTEILNRISRLICVGGLMIFGLGISHPPEPRLADRASKQAPSRNIIDVRLEGLDEWVKTAVYAAAVHQAEHDAAVQHQAEHDAAVQPVTERYVVNEVPRRVESGCAIPAWICELESGGDPTVWNKSGSGASGKYQFLAGTWNGYGGYTNAADAPEWMQDEKAAALWNGGEGCGHWSAC